MIVLAVWWLGAAGMLPAQSPPVHYFHHGVMPPGAIGGQQLQRGGPLPGFFQPVEIKAPPGALISLAAADRFDESQPAPRKAGLLIGGVYRLHVANFRMADGQEVFPTIEIVDRIYAPVGQERRFAIPIDITDEDLKLALDGKFVTRVIYLEDPHQALPARDPQSQNWFEAARGQDPLAIADELGRPVAILRLGGRLPVEGEKLAAGFFFGSPPFVATATESKSQPSPRDANRKSPPKVLSAVSAKPAKPRPAPKDDSPSEGPKL
jgi:hypothetical protein